MRKITEINITKLWGDPDLNIHWKLNPDVNVLAGDNGSGKSTVFDLVDALILRGTGYIKTRLKAERVEVIFNTMESCVFENSKLSIKNLETQAQYDQNAKNLLETLKQEVGSDYKNMPEITYTHFNYDKMKDNAEAEIKEILEFVRTFDRPIHSEEAIKKIKSFEEVKTYMDFELFFTKDKYKSYKIRIGDLASKALFETNGMAAQMKSDVKLKIDRETAFLDKIDELFKYSHKTVDRNNREGLSFLNRLKQPIKLEQLSSGEKQILHILLTALTSDNRPMIMFLDEPEISLHVDWQQDLIKNILDLNPNIQLIIATHSPFIIADGWGNKVTQMDKITFKNNEKYED